MGDLRKKRINFNSFNAAKLGILSFLIFFIVEAILNAKFNMFNKIPNDILSVYHAARLHGYDWSNVANDSAPFSPFATWLYYVIGCIFPLNSFAFARVALLLMVFFRAGVAYLATVITNKFHNVSAGLSVAIGIIVALAIPGRANYLSTVAILVFLFFAALYMVEKFNHNIGSKSVSILMALLFVGLMSTVSFQAIVLVPLTAIYFVLNRTSDKKASVNVLLVSVLGMAVIVALVVILSDLTYSAVAVEGTNIYKVPGTVSNATNDFLRNCKLLLSFSGIRGVIENIFVSFWSVGMYTWTFSVIAFVVGVKRRKNPDMKALRFNIALLGVTLLIKSLDKVLRFIRIHRNQSGLYGNLFDISDYAFIVIPLLMFGLIILVKKEYSIKDIKTSVCALFTSFTLMMLLVILPVLINTKFQVSSVMYQSNSLLLSSLIGATSFESAVMICLAFVTVIFLFVVMFRHIDLMMTLIIMITLFVFQYASGWFFIDNGGRIDREEKIKASYNGLLDTPINDDKVLSQIDKAYCYFGYTGPFLYQFAFMDLTVLPGLPEECEDEFIIFSAYDCETMSLFQDFDGCYYCTIDTENRDEFLYVKGDRYVNLLEEAGMELDDPLKAVEVRENVRRIYKYILFRDADYDGLVGWASVIMGGDCTYEELMEIFLNTGEFKEKNLKKSDIVRQLYYLYRDWAETDDSIFVPSKESVEVFAEVSNNLTLDEIFAFFRR